MKVLIGTDILLCYLYKADYIEGINFLFQWLDKTNYKKYIDFSSIAVLTNYSSTNSFDIFNDFNPILEIPKPTTRIKRMRTNIVYSNAFTKQSAITQLPLLNLLDLRVVDYLITNSITTHTMANEIGLESRVYNIEDFIEKLSIENRELDTTKGVNVIKCKFSSISIDSPFLKDFKEEYNPYYTTWFKKKAKDDVFISFDQDKNVKALLKLKIEDESEIYSDISPIFLPAKRLKISSLKVDYNGQKLGERFMRIIFYKAIIEDVDEIYVTIFDNSKLRTRLIEMIKNWGFEIHGTKDGTKAYKELVFVKNMRSKLLGNLMKDYPRQNIPKQSYIISLHKTYIQQLLPKDTLFQNDLDIMPTKHAIKKVLVIDSKVYNISHGNGLLFYQNALNNEERNLIAIGIVDHVYNTFENLREFLDICRKRSTLSNEELINIWEKSNKNPTVIYFLYICGLEDDNINEDKLSQNGIDIRKLQNESITEITREQYSNILKDTQYEMYINVD